MKYLAQIVFIQILWHQFYKLYNNNLNANIFIQIIFLSMKLNVHWNHPLWLNTPFTFCDSPIEIIPSSRRVPTILPEWFFLHKKTFNYLNKIIQWICHYFIKILFSKKWIPTHTHTHRATWNDGCALISFSLCTLVFSIPYILFQPLGNDI